MSVREDGLSPCGHGPPVNGFRRARLAACGFTMVELLVTVTAISLLAAATIPVLTQQLSKARAVRLIADLASIETAINSFYLDAGSMLPGELEHLSRSPEPESAADTGVDGRFYSFQSVEQWNGPYLDKPISSVVSELDVATSVGTEHGIVNGLGCYDPVANIDTGDACMSESDFVAARIVGLDQEEFDAASVLLDGVADGTEGELRYDPETGIAYFLTVPYVQ
ncbi:MAG: type II secretion system protein [Gemmatimonadota bacterium]